MSHRPIGALVDAFRADVSAILADIAALARAEFRRDAARIGIGAALFAAAGLFATVFFLLLVVVIAQALIAAGLAPWAAYLIDAGIFLVLALAAVLAGKSSFQRVEPPTMTITAVKDAAAALGGLSPEEAAARRAEAGAA